MNTLRYLLIGAVCTLPTSRAAAQEKSPPKPDGATIKAWTDQGFSLEWLSIVDGRLRYDSRPRQGAERPLPVFEYSKNDMGAIDFAKLPAPQVPFGVRLSNGKKGLGATLKGLAGVKNLSGVCVFDCAATEKDWQALEGLKQLTVLDLWGGYQSGTRPPESVLKLLGGYKSLDTLAIHGMRLTEVGVKSLTELKHVRRLVASDTALTDTFLKELKALEDLGDLNLSFTRVTDAGVAVLKDFKNLTALNLASTAITDNCLNDLGQCPKLKVLTVFNTKVTKDGLDKLRKALPDCTINN